MPLHCCQYCLHRISNLIHGNCNKLQHIRRRLVNAHEEGKLWLRTLVRCLPLPTYSRRVKANFVEFFQCIRKQANIWLSTAGTQEHEQLRRLRLHQCGVVHSYLWRENTSKNFVVLLVHQVRTCACGERKYSPEPNCSTTIVHACNKEKWYVRIEESKKKLSVEIRPITPAPFRGPCAAVLNGSNILLLALP